MFILSVAPLTAIPRPAEQELNYFSSRRVLPGQLVEIVLRNRKTVGLVFACRDARTMRMAIRHSSYPLKSIHAILTKSPMFTAIQLDFLRWISEYYYASLGVVCRRTIPALFLKPTKNARRILEQICSAPASAPKFGSAKGIYFIGNERVSYYKKWLTSGRRNRSAGQTLLLVPQRLQIAAARGWVGDFCPSLGTFSSDLPAKSQREIWEDAYCGRVSCVAGTRSALMLPFRELSRIIIDDTHNPSHCSWDQNPHVNSSTAALWLHDNAGVSVAFGAVIPGVETEYRLKARGWDIVYSKERPVSKAVCADMRGELKAGNYSVISVRLRQMILDARENGGQVILFIHRRGFSSGLLCRDCGYIPSCSACDIPLVYHNPPGLAQEPFLVCHHCGARHKPPTVCPSCASYRVKYVGGGTQRVQEEIRKLFPELRVCRMDSDVASGAGAQANLWKQFKDGQYDVMVGTKPVLYPPFDIKVAYSAALIIDPLLSIPDYRGSERVFEIVRRLAFLSKEAYLIQSYGPETPVLKYAIAGQWKEFAQEELLGRKMLKWPPFSQIIRLSYGNKGSNLAEREAKQLKERLETQIRAIRRTDEVEARILGPAPSFIPKVANRFVWNIIIKWPVTAKGDVFRLSLRNRFLDVVPKGWDIDVEPMELVI